ncbi:LysR family transcriptional regulator [Burkholderia sp. Bp9143]|uniref:LysR substrate-binding domain-containing protein n=1 Tax=Burkholderia sp. Bp9143 TaxID=2184574 RepID=UPI000F5A6E54|nr:LysR substrate-binding domain-containing protein [Burkholderia sp. Bp9143]RQR35453.1 LysR family transcriptional regulator [Burkholderia sp. Bp9143]
MKSLRHRLPPLTSLMFFEAAARTLNFTRAAEELHVSQAAVSKQIRQLEEGLGFSLFERVGRRVQLSPRGAQLHGKVSAAFNYLADAVDELSLKRSSTVVTLAANTAISHFWLSEVMKDFRDQNPSFAASIRTITSDHTSDLFHDSVDIAVVYDATQRIDWTGHLLFEEEIFPVASPAYVESHPLAGEGPEALLSQTLLEYERIEPNWINWAAWFASLGIESKRVKATEYGNNYIVLVDAAIRGRGVTLGTRYLLDGELRSGRLARLSSVSVRPGRGYFLMRNDQRPKRPEVEQLYDWLASYRSSEEDATSRGHQGKPRT